MHDFNKNGSNFLIPLCYSLLQCKLFIVTQPVVPVWPGLKQLCNCITTVAIIKHTLGRVLVIQKHDFLGCDCRPIKTPTTNSNSILSGSKADMTTIQPITFNFIASKITAINQLHPNLHDDTRITIFLHQGIPTSKQMKNTRMPIVI